MSAAQPLSASPEQGVAMPPGGPHHAMLETDRCTQWLGAEVLIAEEGHAKLRMTIRPEMTNGFSIVHGGMIFTLADTCFAMACNHPQGDDGTVTVASGADITFLKSARLGDVLTAEAHQVARAGRSGVFDVVVTCEGETVAVFRGRSRTIPTAHEGSSR
ncbi:hydroxyphenylacetyl-CoA thioesterase PaaI [Nesterenkonia haasae]|uniref:hydroxyphenylacetyl-CoA thioesterase PaaI n=1 Tax=Nesterenkonia haasae TaxID=2587813 RepID=UPI002E2CB750|nr:hydroxyphenylacetyl-CoA thioesterase PaaI [Nesterenkonia haasae]